MFLTEVAQSWEILFNKSYVNSASFECTTLKRHFVMLIEDILYASTPESFFNQQQRKMNICVSCSFVCQLGDIMKCGLRCVVKW